MRKVKHPSAVPYYAAAGLWLLWCMALPMYRLWHLILLLALSTGLFVGMKKLFPGTVSYVTEPEPPTGNPELDEAVLRGKEAISELRDLNARLPDPTITKKLDRMEALTQSIFAYVREHPDQLSTTRRFMNYYLPTTLKLLRSYEELSRTGSTSSEVTKAMGRIEGLLDTVLDAFQKQLDSLYASDVIDITAEISVMETMMKNEGFNI